VRVDVSDVKLPLLALLLIQCVIEIHYLSLRKDLDIGLGDITECLDSLLVEMDVCPFVKFGRVRTRN
jgi:hypothetical protein